MAAFLWRFMGSPVGSPAAGFHDVPAGSFAGEAIDWLLDSGTTVGCTEAAFCPEESTTRAEMFTFLRRLEDAA
jgi:hypothetical protein